MKIGNEESVFLPGGLTELDWKEINSGFVWEYRGSGVSICITRKAFAKKNKYTITSHALDEEGNEHGDPTRSTAETLDRAKSAGLAQLKLHQFLTGQIESA